MENNRKSTLESTLGSTRESSPISESTPESTFGSTFGGFPVLGSLTLGPIFESLLSCLGSLWSDPGSHFLGHFNSLSLFL